MARLFFYTHPDVVIDPDVPVTEWPLSEPGRKKAESFARSLAAHSFTSLWCSTEQKAIDAARILGDTLGLEPACRHDLGENDRNSTGFLPRDEFEATADQFFADPDISVRGWATASDEQSRIVAAVTSIRKQAPAGEIMIVSHGAVGALLLAWSLGARISRDYDQPQNGGGNLLMFDRETMQGAEGWLEARLPATDQVSLTE